MQNRKFRLICLNLVSTCSSHRVPTLCTYGHKQQNYLMFKVAKSCVMSAIAVERLLKCTNSMRISFAHDVTALIFYNITRCYGKHVAAFAVTVATGDIIKYQLFVYGNFVWGIHVRYSNKNIIPLKYDYQMRLGIYGIYCSMLSLLLGASCVN